MLGFATLARKVFGTPNDRKVKSVRPLVAKINALEPEYAALSDEEAVATARRAPLAVSGALTALFAMAHGYAHGSEMVSGAARGLYTGPQYLNTANTQEIPDWWRLDLGARYSFEAAGTPITIRANVENVLDDRYWMSAARGGYKMGAPRTFLLSSTVSF